MMNFIRHLYQEKIISLLIFAAILLMSCGEEQKKGEYVARVNDSYLTSEELATLIDTNSSNTFYRSEVIRNWVNRELLYQEAKRKGILEEESYKRIINNSAKELASTLLLNQFVPAVEINFEPRDIVNYFEKNQNDFKLTYNAYLLNIIYFNNEDCAVEFRSLLLDSDWQKTLNVFHGDTTIISVETEVLLKEQDIYPAKLLRVVKRLYPFEISIVISDQAGYYTIAQVLGKYSIGSILPFGVVKTEVEKRYVAVKRKELLENYINDLYLNNEIEVKN